MILDGKLTATYVRKQVAEEVRRINDTVTLALIMVGNNPASQVYVRNKQKACDEVGISVESFFLDENTSQKELLTIIENCNKNPKVNGILVQLPLPTHIEEKIVVNSIDPEKDVDGLNTLNQGKLMVGEEGLVPATPKGVITLLKSNNIDIQSKNVVVVGRSKLVGKPLAMLFLNENATVTIAHSKTANLKEVTKKADILVAAVGKPKFIVADMVKRDCVVVDVGINRLDGKLCGDVDYEGVSEVASFVTPVPGGVGPMTIATLLENVPEDCCSRFDSGYCNSGTLPVGLLLE